LKKPPASKLTFLRFSSSTGGSPSCTKPKALSLLTVAKRAAHGAVLPKHKGTSSHT
jgi:hypothetical protein